MLGNKTNIPLISTAAILAFYLTTIGVIIYFRTRVFPATMDEHLPITKVRVFQTRAEIKLCYPYKLMENIIYGNSIKWDDLKWVEFYGYEIQ
jgi:hypothetical protein